MSFDHLTSFGAEHYFQRMERHGSKSGLSQAETHLVISARLGRLPDGYFTLHDFQTLFKEKPGPVAKLTLRIVEDEARRREDSIGQLLNYADWPVESIRAGEELFEGKKPLPFDELQAKLYPHLFDGDSGKFLVGSRPELKQIAKAGGVFINVDQLKPKQLRWILEENWGEKGFTRGSEKRAGGLEHRIEARRAVLKKKREAFSQSIFTKNGA